MLPPPITALTPQEAVTTERFRLLAIGYYISGAIGCVLVSFLLIHFAMVLGFSFIPESAWDTTKSGTSSSEPPPVIVFKIIAGILGAIILAGWTLGGLTIYAGRCIARRKSRTFVLIMAALNCLWIPYGTLLGVVSLIFLTSPDAKNSFDARHAQEN